MIAYIVMGLAAVALLAILWLRDRHLTRTDIALAEQPNRGIIGEATTAFEDVGRQFLQEDKQQRPAKNRAQASREIDPLSLLAFGVLLEDIQKHSIYKRLLANTGNALNPSLKSACLRTAENAPGTERSRLSVRDAPMPHIQLSSPISL